MFHLGLPSSQMCWNSHGVRIVSPGPFGIGEITVATCANEEIAWVLVTAFSAAPLNLREAVFKRPESAALAVFGGMEGWEPADDGSPWEYGPDTLSEAGQIRAYLREWMNLGHTRTDATFVALCAFVQSALDAADRFDSVRL